jgi:hypothetical protein
MSTMRRSRDCYNSTAPYTLPRCVELPRDRAAFPLHPTPDANARADRIPFLRLSDLRLVG